MRRHVNQDRDIRRRAAATSRRGGASGARRRKLAVGLLIVVAAVVAVGVALAVAVAAPAQRGAAARSVLAASVASDGVSSDAPAPSPPSFAVGLRVLRLLDRSRTIRLKGGRSEPRTLVTYVRYPALGAPGEVDVPNAAPASAGGPYPLVVFGPRLSRSPWKLVAAVRV